MTTCTRLAGKSGALDDDDAISRIADILVARLRNRKYKALSADLPTKQRRKLLKLYYPLPQRKSPSGGYCWRS